MVRSGLQFLLITILFLTGLSVQAQIIASIDRNPINANETFTLTFSTNMALEEKPALPGMPSSFVEQSARSFFNGTTVNGVTTVKAGWVFTFQATQEGIFTIPSFNINGERTEAIQLKVLPAVNATDVNGQQNAIFLTSEVDVDEVYVQQQVLFTIKLYRAVQAQYATLTEPTMEGALVERLGDDRQYETEINNVRYIVLERSYVLFPQQPGSYQIPEILFNAEVSEGSRRYSTFGRLRSTTRPITLSTDPVNITVKPKPDSSDGWWLPAKNVELTEAWSPSSQTFRVGEPMTWTLSVKAQGLSATQLPEIQPEAVEGFKFYPDSPVSDSEVQGTDIIGMRTQKIAVLPTKAGEFTLPEITLEWWNIRTDQAETIRIAARSVTILPSLDGDTGEPAVPETQQPAQTDSVIEQSSPATSEDSKPAQVVTPSSEDQQAELWKYAAFVFAALWLMTVIQVLKRKSPAEVINEEISKPDYDTSKAWKALKQALQKEQPEALKDALLIWCQSHPLTTDIRSLGSLVNRLGKESSLAGALREIEVALYSSKPAGPLPYQRIKQSLNELKVLHVESTQENSQSLPALHLTD